MLLATLRHALVTLFHRLDERLTDAAYCHGRYRVSDGKIRRRMPR